MRLGLVTLIAALSMTITAIVVQGASASIVPCAIDDSGNCITATGCDPYNGTTPDCYLDDGYFEADVDTYYGYGSGACFSAHGRRGGTWWTVHYDRFNICVSSGTVTSLGSGAGYATSSLWWPASWAYGPDLDWSQSEGGVGTGSASAAMSFAFRWCSKIACSSRAYGYIVIDVAGWGGVSCRSDRGYIPNCKGRV